MAEADGLLKANSVFITAAVKKLVLQAFASADSTDINCGLRSASVIDLTAAGETV